VKQNNQIKMTFHLTNREQEILGLIVKELTTEQIANYLQISIATVESHRRNMYLKLGVQSVVGLVKEALKNGLIKL
jgi:DNA-binding CsgD family transcriptional regulator